MFAEPLQERRTVRVVAARRVALQVSNTQPIAHHSHYCNYESAFLLPSLPACIYISFGMRVVRLRAKRPQAIGRVLQSAFIFILREHRHVRIFFIINFMLFYVIVKSPSSRSKLSRIASQSRRLRILREIKSDI